MAQVRMTGISVTVILWLKYDSYELHLLYFIYQYSEGYYRDPCHHLKSFSLVIVEDYLPRTCYIDCRKESAGDK